MATCGNGARRGVLENSYYWRHPPLFIGLLSRTALGVADPEPKFLSAKIMGATAEGRERILKKVKPCTTKRPCWNPLWVSELTLTFWRKLLAEANSPRRQLSRLRNEIGYLQVRLDILQSGNNTLRVQLEAGLSVISYLEQRLKFHLKSLLVPAADGTTHQLRNAA